MNVYYFIVLFALLAAYFLDVLADYLNIRNLRPELPEEFSDVWNREKYQKSQEYLKVRTRFGIISSTFGLLVLLLFWHLGGFPLLDSLAGQISESEILRGLAFVGILIMAQSLLTFPFKIYSTFVIEERFGFNKTGPGTFILDLLKSSLLAILIGGPALAGILWILGNAGPYAWLYAWAATTLLSAIVQYIAPRWIMPLFNKFTPLPEGELRDEITNYARENNFMLDNIYVMDGSRRSSKSNAFFTGFGKNKRIALFDTLIEKLGTGEMIAVLAHEIGHYKKKHIRNGMVISFLHTGVLFFLLSLFLYEERLYQAFFMNSTPVYAGLLFFGMLYTPLDMILSVFMNIISRKNEFQADRFAAETTHKPREMIAALKKLSESNLSNLTPHPFNVFVNYSHPPVLERIKALKGMEIDKD